MKKLMTPIRLAFILSIYLLQGCETLGPSMPGKLTIADKTTVSSNIESKGEALLEGPTVEKTSTETSKSAQPTPTAEIYKGTGVFSKPLKKTIGVKSSNKKGSFTLNFNDVELSEVIKVILGDTLNYTFSISPKVVGKVSLHTAKSLTKDELLPTLQALLSMHNAVLLQEGPLYRVELTSAVLAGGNIPLLKKKSGAYGGFQIQVIPLKFVGVEDMKKVLEPILHKQAILRADTNRNLLFITGTPSELSNALELVNLFDIDLMRGKSIGLFPLVNAEPRTIERELTEIFGSQADNPLSGMIKMMPIDRLNALMVISPQAHYITQVETWIKRLDKAGSDGRGGRVHVYQVQHVDAVELAAILDQVYADKDTSFNSTAINSNVAPGLKEATISTGAPANKSSATDSDASLGVSTEVSGPLRIIPDEANNSLVIVATAHDYQSILQVIKKLDVTPLQVLVDATIIEVSLTDELHYGLRWFFTNKSSLGTGSAGDANTIAAGVGGFSYSLVNSAGVVRAELNALANDSKVNVLSAPSLMVLNNQEAIIKVGDQVPIRTSESANTNATVGGSTLITSTIELRDTGVTLIVKPRVNAGGLVIMEIEQNVDGVSRTESSEIDSPTIQQRQIKSTVAVQSGETIVLGGLITEQREHGKSGVPVLSRLPVVGALFGKTDKVLDRTELVVLITPKVVRNQQEAQLITKEFKKKLGNIFK